ncbi:MAG TPA: FAD-binding protein [Burkholderiales bacterium]
MSFIPDAHYRPTSVQEVLDCLHRHRGERIRCIGSAHSWSRVLATEGVLLDLAALDAAEVESESRARVGAGCTLGRLLKVLARKGLTLPTLGAIDKQTIAGAISTGTHGSGCHSLSHYVEQVRIARADAQVATIDGGASLAAARCGLGALGVLIDVAIRVVPAYRIEERFRNTEQLASVLDEAGEWPLQQFALLPWSWRYLVWHRRRTEARGSRIRARLARWYLLIVNDFLMHALLKGVLLRLANARVRAFYRVLGRLMKWSPHRIDDSVRILTMRHDLFAHVEMELFVPAFRITEAIGTLREILELAAGVRRSCSEDLRRALAHVGMDAEVADLHGTWTQHYPLFFRRVLADDTLVSMACEGERPGEPWYSISFFTYRTVDVRFTRFATAVARCVLRLYGGRLHWGKFFPVPFGEASANYARFDEFRDVCRAYDPARAFWSENL